VVGEVSHGAVVVHRASAGTSPRADGPGWQATKRAPTKTEAFIWGSLVAAYRIALKLRRAEEKVVIQYPARAGSFKRLLDGPS